MPVVGRLLLLAFCLVAFAAVGVLAGQAATPSIDTMTTTWLHDLADPDLDLLMSAITGLGATPLLAAVVGLAIVGLVVRGHRTEALFIGLALVVSVILNQALKLLFARPRPELDWAEIRPDYAFPSGHAMNSTAVYLALALVIAWRLSDRRVVIGAVVLSVALVIAIGLSRIYLGAHWMTDVIGGFLAGAIVLLVLAGAFLAARPQGRRSERPPASASDPPSKERP